MPIELTYPEYTFKDEGIRLRAGNDPSLAELGVMGFGYGASAIAGTATIIGGGVTRAVNEPEGDKWFKFYDEKIAPARKAFTPDPETTNLAGKIVHGLGSLLPAVATGPTLAPSLLMGSTGIMEGIDLVDKGVDPTTATLAAAGTAAFTGAQVYMPMAGRTLPKTAGLVAASDVVGMAQRGAMNAGLSQAGYFDIARNYDPFALDAIAIDTVMGGLFGALGHRANKAVDKVFTKEKQAALDATNRMIESKAYGDWLKTLPIEAEDALSVIRQYQRNISEMPFDPKRPAAVHDHLTAMDKAVQDLIEGKAVHVEGVIRNAQLAAPGAKQNTAAEPVAAALKELEAVHTEAEKHLSPPLEVTIREDWGAGSSAIHPKKAEIRRDMIVARAPKVPVQADPAQLAFVRDFIASLSGEGALTGKAMKDAEGLSAGRFGSPYPEWFQNRGYKAKEVIKLLDKAMKGESLTERQRGIVQDLMESSGRDYDKARPLIESHAARTIEAEFEAGRDLPGEFLGVGSDGIPQFSSAKERIDALKSEYKKTAQMESAFNRIAKCVIGG